MPLNWYLDKVERPEELRGDNGDLLPKTQTLVLLTMPTGFNQITKKNVDEVWARVRLWEALNGPFCYDGESPDPLTREDVERHVGLATNAASFTRARFLQQLWREAEEG